MSALPAERAEEGRRVQLRLDLESDLKLLECQLKLLKDAVNACSNMVSAARQRGTEDGVREHVRGILGRTNRSLNAYRAIKKV